MNTTNPNPQTTQSPNVQQQMQMSDKDILNDILSVTKGGCELFMHGTIEANSPNVQETFKNCLLETLAIHAETYKTMQSKGWYQTEPVQKQKIEQTKQKLANS